MTAQAKWFSHLVWTVFENHGFSQVADLPSHKRLALGGSVMTAYHGITHPSGPNYRALAAGEYWRADEFIDEKHLCIADALSGESIDTLLVNLKGVCAQRHNPFLDLHAPFTTLHPGSFMPDVWSSKFKHMYLGWDDNNNGHSAPVEIADRNLNEILDALDSSVFFNTPVDGLYPAFFIVWDEVYTDPDNRVFAAWYGKGVKKGFQDTVFRNHYSFTATVLNNWSLPPLNHSAGVTPMSEVFQAS